MRKYLVILVIVYLAVYSNVHAQFCGTDELLLQRFEKDPGLKTHFLFLQRQAEINDSLFSLHGNNYKTVSAIVYTVPVVFHILHEYGSENISDAQVYDELNILNQDFRKQNSDTTNIYPPFKAADVNIEFHLATKDTLGNCTTGIIHHYDPNTNWSTAFSSPNEFKYTWNCHKYLNVYIVRSITGFSSGGYSSFPGTNPGYADVIVVMNNCIGSFGTSNPTRSRLLTHEVGHWFNLQHIWGNGVCGAACNDDGVTDTPITKGWTSCPSNTLSAVCNSGITENYQNYMDYTFCKCMFTAGQANRMNTAITSTVSGRNNLWTSGNLVLTGANNPTPACQLIADCYSTNGVAVNFYTVCAGGSLAFVDASYNGTVATVNWMCTGSANIASPTSTATSITFPNAGTYTVTLTVNNSYGSSITTRTVTVLNAATNITTSYQESFEASGLPANFNIINGGNWPTWTQTSAAAATGTNCYFISGYADQAGSVDILETPSYDFLNNTGAQFTFKYAYASYSTTTNDVFKVQVSSDCGGSWTDINFGTASSLSSGSGGVTTASFVPVPSQFKTYTITANPIFTPFKSEANVRFRFYFQKDTITLHGNNIYVDDINFISFTGIRELNMADEINVFPNPANNIIYLKSSPDYEIKKIVILTVEGKELIVKSINKNEIEVGNIPDGLYFLRLYINENFLVKKIVIQH